MRGVIFAVILSITQVLAVNIYSQNTPLTLNLKNTSIRDILGYIQDNSEFFFIYDASVVDIQKKITIKAKNKLIPEILDEIFEGSNVVYKIVDRQIALTKVKSPVTEIQQQKSVSGKITDESDQPLPGVTVVVMGTTQGTVTNADGNYSLTNIPDDATLVFSFVGMKTLEIPVAGKTTINVVMQIESIGIEEVVAVGYGTQKKETLSGSVASVSGVEIAKSPAMNVSNSLAGSLPGLVAVGQSGEPGADYSNLYIRGRSTLNDNSPLIVVDGIPNRSLERIDPETIENVTLLKDASAAIYGSQAANGVILVTTKRGAEGKYSVTANITTGWSQPTRIPEMTNSAEYATLVNEVNMYNGKPKTYPEADIARYAEGNDPWHYPSTDWFVEVLKPWSLQSLANITMSGGNENMRSFVSVSTRYQDGYFYNSASKYLQHDLRTNIDKKINDYIDLSLDASIRLEQRNFPTVSSASIFKSLMGALPMQVAHWPNGKPGPPLDATSQNNPVVQATPEAGLQEGENYVINVNSKLNVKIPWVDGLVFTATGSLDRGLNYTKSFSKRYTLYEWDGETTTNEGLPYLVPQDFGASSLKQQLGINKQYLINSYFTYKNRIKELHNINLTAGLEFIENNYNWFSASRRYFAQNYPDELNFGDPNEQYAEGSRPGTNRWQNYFGRVNYSFKEKYIAEFVWRYQGSSKFHPDTRWGFFPGISAAYRISEEKFWKSGNISNFISDLKLRASWGKTGNDLIPPYQFFSLYSLYWQSFVTGDNIYHQVYHETLAGNVKAQWEEADQFGLGLDFFMLNSRLNITADYFNDLRTKILISQVASIPQMTGMAGKLPKINLGRVLNRGFDFQITWRDNVGSLKYSIGLNGVHAQNKVLFFDEAEGAPEWQKQTGYPMQSGLYYEAIGIYRTMEDLEKYPHFDEARLGDVIFKDVSGDGKITGDDMKRVYKNSVPTLTGGLNITMNYKNFDFSSVLQGQAGAVRYVQYRGSVGGQNYFKRFYDNRWTEDNPDASFPRTFNRNDEYWVSSENSNTFWLHKTDFIRLKNLELGYTLPNSLTKRTGLADVRVHVGGMNLFTYSPDMKDFDPELEPKGDGFAGQGYPTQKIITTGLTVKF